MAVLAQRVLYAGVRILGPRIIPGAREPWEHPLPEDRWRDLVDRWSGSVGRVDSAAMYYRPQAGRTGFSVLLLREGRGVGFARVSTESERLAHEAKVIAALNAARPESFRVAGLLGSDTSDDVGWLLTESVPNYPLGAVRRASARASVAAELSTILAGALPRPSGVPAHWTPAHGDFSPWNLRTHLNGSIQVIDWEDAGYAPPGVDVLYGGLTAHVSMGTPLPGSAPAEARGWVDELLSDRIDTQPETAHLNGQTREILRSIPVED